VDIEQTFFWFTEFATYSFYFMLALRFSTNPPVINRAKHFNNLRGI